MKEKIKKPLKVLCIIIILLVIFWAWMDYKDFKQRTLKKGVTLEELSKEYLRIFPDETPSLYKSFSIEKKLTAEEIEKIKQDRSNYIFLKWINSFNPFSKLRD